MSANEPSLIFRGNVPSGTTKYFPLPIRNAAAGAQVAWLDATSAGTITVELSSTPGAAVDSDTSAAHWTDSGQTFTGPGGTAIGSALIDVFSVRQKLARIKFVASANSNLEIWDGTSP